MCKGKLIYNASKNVGETKDENNTGRECISRQNLNENLETLHLAPTLFSHPPGFYFKTGFLNPHPWSFALIHMKDMYRTYLKTILTQTEKLLLVRFVFLI